MAFARAFCTHMPRRARGPADCFAYHVINRAVRRETLFHSADDYRDFELLLLQTLRSVPINLFAYCAMRNHWHLVVGPRAAYALPRFMHRLTGIHAQRWHRDHDTTGTGPVYQGRYKAVAIESGEQFLVTCRYVEQNALRAELVERAEDWRWSSLWRRCHQCDEELTSSWPVARPVNWLECVNGPWQAR
jgi:putative transposase